jgi:hypothetical protein
VLVYSTPLQFTPPILNLHTVILDSQAVLTALEIAPDGAMTADERKRLAAGALARDRGPLAAVLRQTAAADSCSGSALHSSSTTATASAGTAGGAASTTAAGAAANSMLSASAVSASTPSFSNGFSNGYANGKQPTVELGAGFDTLNTAAGGAPARGRVRSRSFNGRAQTGSAHQTSSFSPPGGQIRVPGRGVRNGRRALHGRSPLRSSGARSSSRSRSPGLLQHQQLPYRGGTSASDAAADAIDESDEEQGEYGWSDVESARHRRRVSTCSFGFACMVSLVCEAAV